MRIDEIRLINFRAFERLRLELDPRVTVLVGRNGSGKSTVLEGLAVALDVWLRGMSGNPMLLASRSIPSSTARLALREHEGVPTAERCYPVRVEAVGSVGGSRVEWTQELDADGRPRGNYEELVHSMRRTREGLGEAVPEILPVVVCYGTDRLWLGKRDAGSNSLQSRLDGYRSALKAAANHKGFEAWMAWREGDRVQRVAQAAEEGRPLSEVKSPQLDAVRAAAASCLEGAKRFYYSLNHQELRIDFETGPSIPFDALSDGQRNLIAVAADIAWRAAQLNPHLGASAPTETPGVVLIDELDLHLHPAWQLRVLDDLLRAFPKMQFVVTTHSPQVMSSAPPGTVRLLDAQHEPHRVDRLRGKDTNSILEDILGVPSRPPRFKEKLEELSRRIEDEKLDEARALIAELEQELGDTEDAALVAARWELSMAQGKHAED